MDACMLCGNEMKGGTLTCGAELCDVCYAGDLRERVRASGIEITSDWKRTTSRANESGRHHTIRKTVSGRVRLSQPAPVATFSREGVGVRIRKFFGLGPDELEIGDAPFDDAVLVDTRTPDLTREALAHEGLRSVVLECVAHFDRLELDADDDGARVTLYSVEHPNRWKEPREGQQRLVALALMYLRRVLG